MESEECGGFLVELNIASFTSADDIMGDSDVKLPPHMQLRNRCFQIKRNKHTKK